MQMHSSGAVLSCASRYAFALCVPWVEGETFIGPVDYRHQMLTIDNKDLYQPNPPYNTGMRVYRMQPGMRPWRNPSPFFPDYATPYDQIPSGESEPRPRTFSVTRYGGEGKTGDDLQMCTLQ